MEVIDVTASLEDVDFSPETEMAEILQNVKTIITTVKSTVPLDREFGIDGSILDMPINYVKAKLTAEIIEKVQKYEPRVKVLKVSYEENSEGKLLPTVRVVIK